MSAQEVSKNAEVPSEESVLKTEVTDDGVNKNTMHCLRCSSKILLPNHGSLKEIQFDLPSMRKKQDAATAATVVDLETVKHFWLVPNMFTFENIGFTHTVGDIKYLACADCDVGPIGWSDTKSQQSYIALNRVRYLP